MLTYTVIRARVHAHILPFACLSGLSHVLCAVWQCSWHWSGQFLASGGMDHCSKLWDIARGLCVSTLRGHSDSVNAVHFLPFSNSLLSASADKTLSLWDIRTVCTQPLTPTCSDAPPPTLTGTVCTDIHWPPKLLQRCHFRYEGLLRHTAA